MIVRPIPLLLLAPILASCQTTGPMSIKGGECKIFERPEYAVLGKRQYDQDWIDSQVEGGVGGCNWRRPAARPASLDAAGQKIAAPVRKKRGLIKRIKDRVARPFTVRVAPIIETPHPAIVAPPAPAKPRDPVDELLNPGGE